jgi:hypothetical protein
MELPRIHDVPRAHEVEFLAGGGELFQGIVQQKDAETPFRMMAAERAGQDPGVGEIVPCDDGTGVHVAILDPLGKGRERGRALFPALIG